MKKRNFTFDGRMIVTDLELFNKAMSRYRAKCDKLGACIAIPSASSTVFEKIDACRVRVTLHNGITGNESVYGDPKACLFSTKIKVTDDAENSYSFYEMGLN